MPAPPTQREIGQIVALRAGGKSIREIAKLIDRSPRCVNVALKKLDLDDPENSLLQADVHLTRLAPLAAINVSETMTGDDPRLKYEASRDYLRGRRLYTDSVDVTNYNARPTADLVQLLTDALNSIKSNTAIESTEAEFEVVENSAETSVKQLPTSDQSTNE